MGVFLGHEIDDLVETVTAECSLARKASPSPLVSQDSYYAGERRVAKWVYGWDSVRKGFTASR